MPRFDRRSFLGVSALALGGTALTSDAVTGEAPTSGTEADPGPWSQYRVNAANTGAASTAGPREYLEVAWVNRRRDAGGDIGYYGIQSHPALVDGTLYVTSLEDDRGETWIHSIDASDGTENWRFEEQELRHRSTPAVAAGRVLVGGDRFAGGLLALDAADGTERWRADRNVVGSPTVADGTVYVATVDSEGAAELAALDVRDGSVVWSVDPTADGTNWLSASAHAVVGDTVYVNADVDDGTDSGRSVLYAVAAETGDRRWTAEHDGMPVVDDGRVYISDDEQLFALDAATGEEQWSSGVAVPAVADGTLYAADGRGRELVALDAATGEEIWRLDVSEETDGEDTGAAKISSDVVIAGDTLYFGTRDRGIWAVDAAEGTLLDNALGDLGMLIDAPPAVAGDTAYAGGSFGEHGLYAVVGGSPPPAPELEFVDEKGSPHCVGEDVWYRREANKPDAETINEGDYAWRMDFDTSDDEVGPWDEDIYGGIGEVVKHAYEEAGTYEAALTMRDPEGRTTTETVTVEVVECPTARFETDPPDAEERDLESGSTVTLDASTSSSPHGEIVSYEWDVTNDGNYDRSGATTEVELAFCGDLEVSLRVTDEEDLTDTVDFTLSTDR